MTEQALKDFIAKGEGVDLEFKSSFNDGVIETLSAFANAKGGIVLVGIDDHGIPVSGFVLGKESFQNWINEIKNKTVPGLIPDVDSVMFEGRVVAYFSISEFPVKPVAFKGRYFKRVNNSNHLLSAIEIAELSIHSLQVSWDSYEAVEKGLDQLDINKVNRFFDRVKAIGRFNLDGDAFDGLKKLRLIDGNKIPNAAWLLFSAKPTGYNVHIGRFKTPSYIIDDKILNGSLFEVVEETMNYIVSHIKVAFEITGSTTQRAEIFEYPLTALRELVLNALIHRDYLSPIDIQIKFFDNSISFYSPGTLLGNLTIEELKQDDYSANTRNKLISEAFYLTGDIEKYGSGFIRIRKEIAQYPTMTLEMKEMSNVFLVGLQYAEQKISTIPINERVNERVNKLSKNENLLVDVIEKEPSITQKQLAAELRLTEQYVRKLMKKLKDHGVIRRIGSDKSGRWEIC